MQLDSTVLAIAAIIAITVAIIVGAYVIMIYNDLNGRREKLRALTANIRALRLRREGIGQDIGQRLGRAQHHEREVTRFGSQRGRGRGRFVSDNFNGWPVIQLAGATSQAISTASQARDAELAMREELHDHARQYNSIVRSYPQCIIANACGFYPWRFNTSRRPADRNGR